MPHKKNDKTVTQVEPPIPVRRRNCVSSHRKSKKSVKGKRTTLKDTCVGLILEADHDLHKYYVALKNSETTKEEKAWVKVDDLTLLTKEDETKRQKNARVD